MYGSIARENESFEQPPRGATMRQHLRISAAMIATGALLTAAVAAAPASASGEGADTAPPTIAPEPAAPPSSSTPRVGPFRGAGTWVSIFAGDPIWDHPKAHVRRMHAHGIRTLYLQTASSSTPQDTALYRPSQLARFINAAHARKMRVVAWYLPPLRHVPGETARALAAIRFRTAAGQRFDGFALDIEPSATTPKGQLRNDNLRRISRRIRDAVGTRYPLGAIIPSPLGMQISTRFWPEFPYEMLARHYDVFLPMSYHTYRVTGGPDTYAYTWGNIAFLRDRLGPDLPIALIGGSASASNRAETRAFVLAVNDASITGASFWHYGAYGAEDWQELALLRY